ncbi:facilitated trehalose transporter Tret1-like isoform X2 [Venturia canescens]|nr:facilitated trehalose transporter Tret1-like isoform X2 [Venturia canescens]
MGMSILANISVIGPAMGFGYSAVVLPTLQSADSELKIDPRQASWIASAAAIGTPLGCLLCSFVMRRGRKISLLVTSSFSLAGWLVIYMSSSYAQIVVGRFIGGIATGLAAVPATVYSAEVASPKWRGTLATWSSIAIATGILIVYIFGYLLQDNWRLIALLCSLFPTAAIGVTLLVIPESPIWLKETGRTEEARAIMKKFRGIPAAAPTPPELEAELHKKQHPKKKPMLRHLLRRSSIVPFAIIVTYFFFQQFSGIFVIVYYAVEISRDAGVKMDAYLGAILIGTTRLFGSLLAASVSRRFGRRWPSIISGIGMSLFMGSLSIYLFAIDRGYELGDNGLVPVICVLMFIFMSTIGFLVLPFAMIGEIFPAKVKDILSGATTSLAYVFSFVTVKTYPDMLSLAGKHGVFCFYATVSLLGTLYVAIFLPETKGKTLHEIDEMFSRNKPRSEEQQPEKAAIFPMKDLAAVEA